MNRLKPVAQVGQGRVAILAQVPAVSRAGPVVVCVSSRARAWP
ncbi:hypothetical protein [Nonomuraea sp. MG754425]|nr:hypothetical protein [Nonomuraea sp. MG754425]